LLDAGVQQERISFVAKRLPSWVRLRLLAIAPGRWRAFDPDEWRATLVVIERGELEFECIDGHRWRRSRGDVMFLAGLPLRILRNDGPETVLLSAVSRARTEGDHSQPR
jgi:hypothetical protein